MNMKSLIKIRLTFLKAQINKQQANIKHYVYRNWTIINKMKITIKTKGIKTDTFKATCFMDYYYHHYF